MTIEQMCRDLLDKAVADGLVTFNAANFVCTAEPQQLTGCDLCGMANLLQGFFAADRAAGDANAGPFFIQTTSDECDYLTIQCP